MGMEFPSDLEWLSWVVGSDWPHGDEDGLWRMAEAFNQAAQDLRGLIGQGDSAYYDVLAGIEGTAADRLGQYWGLYGSSAGDDGYIEKLAKLLEGLGEHCDGTGTEIEYAKYQFYLALAMLAIQVLWLIAMAIPSFGETLAEIPIVEFATQMLSRTLAQQLMKAIMMGIVQNVLSDVLIQAVQIGEGHRTELDWGKVKGDVVSGAVGGLAGGLVGHGTGKMFGEDFGKTLVGNVLNGALGGAAGGLGTDLVTGQPIDGHALLEGATSGGVGGAVGHGTEWAKNRHGGGDDPVDGFPGHHSGGGDNLASAAKDLGDGPEAPPDFDASGSDDNASSSDSSTASGEDQRSYAGEESRPYGEDSANGPEPEAATTAPDRAPRTEDSTAQPQTTETAYRQPEDSGAARPDTTETAYREPDSTSAQSDPYVTDRSHDDVPPPTDSRTIYDTLNPSSEREPAPAEQSAPAEHAVPTETTEHSAPTETGHTATESVREPAAETGAAPSAPSHGGQSGGQVHARHEPEGTSLAGAGTDDPVLVAPTTNSPTTPRTADPATSAPPPSLGVPGVGVGTGGPVGGSRRGTPRDGGFGYRSGESGREPLPSQRRTEEVPQGRDLGDRRDSTGLTDHDVAASHAEQPATEDPAAGSHAAEHPATDHSTGHHASERDAGEHKFRERFGGVSGEHGQVLDRGGIRPSSEGGSAGIREVPGRRGPEGNDLAGREDRSDREGSGTGVSNSKGSPGGLDDAAAGTDRSEPGGGTRDTDRNLFRHLNDGRRSGSTPENHQFWSRDDGAVRGLPEGGGDRAGSHVPLRTERDGDDRSRAPERTDTGRTPVTPEHAPRHEPPTHPEPESHVRPDEPPTRSEHPETPEHRGPEQHSQPDESHPGRAGEPKLRKPYGDSPLHRFVDGIHRRLRETFTAGGREERVYRENIAEHHRQVVEKLNRRLVPGPDGHFHRPTELSRKANEHRNLAQEHVRDWESAQRHGQQQRAYEGLAAADARARHAAADRLQATDPRSSHRMRHEAHRAEQSARSHRLRAEQAEQQARAHQEQGQRHFDEAEKWGKPADAVTRALRRTEGHSAWELANQDRGTLVRDHDGPQRSALTGSDDPPPGHRSRPYDQPGGLRRPLAEHQRQLERSWPRDQDGNFQRHPQLSERLVDRINHFGWHDDPTRRMNCNDTVASFYDGWMHGRPTVAAPCSFDGYTGGSTQRMSDGEHSGPGRIEDLTGGRYQSLVDDVSRQLPEDRARTVRDGFARIEQQLLRGGHGSFASVVTAWHAGSAHAWAIVNDGGTVKYVDVQSGRVSEHLDRVFTSAGIDRLDALVMDGNGHPLPFDGAPGGHWNARPMTPDYQEHLPPEERTAAAARASRLQASREHEQATFFRSEADRHRAEAARADRDMTQQRQSMDRARRAELAATEHLRQARRHEQEHERHSVEHADELSHRAGGHDRAARSHLEAADAAQKRVESVDTEAAARRQERDDATRQAAEARQEAAAQEAHARTTRSPAERQDALRRAGDSHQQAAVADQRARDLNRSIVRDEPRWAHEKQTAQEHEQRAKRSADHESALAGQAQQAEKAYRRSASSRSGSNEHDLGHRDVRRADNAAQHAQQSYRDTRWSSDPSSYIDQRVEHEVRRPDEDRALERENTPYGRSPARRFADAVGERVRALFSRDFREHRAYRENLLEHRREAARRFDRHVRIDESGQRVLAGDERRRAAAQEAQAIRSADLAKEAQQAATQARQDAHAARTQAEQYRRQSTALDPRDPRVAQFRHEAVRLDEHARRSDGYAHSAEDAADRYTADSSRASYEAQRAYRYLDELTGNLYGREGTEAWRLANDEHGRFLADDGPAHQRSALTGTGEPEPAHLRRHYDEPGGLRRVLEQDQRDLERHWPTDAHGNPLRTPQLDHEWFDRINHFGQGRDPGRFNNCNDSMRSFLDSWLHGRPTVAAPRTFDGYEHGNPSRWFDGEHDGPGSIEDQTGGRYQALVHDNSNLSPQERYRSVRAGFDRLRQQLIDGGPGSAASIVTSWSAGGAHAWGMVNDGGRIVFVDPQSGRYSEHLHEVFDAPKPPGTPAELLITRLDALVVDDHARPMPFDRASRGAFNARPLTTDYQQYLPPNEQSGSAVRDYRQHAEQHRAPVEQHDREHAYHRAQEQRYAAQVEHERQVQEQQRDAEDRHTRERDDATARAQRHEQVAAEHEQRAAELRRNAREVEALQHDDDAQAERARAETLHRSAAEHEQQRQQAEQLRRESITRERNTEYERLQAEHARDRAEREVVTHQSQLDQYEHQYARQAEYLSSEYDKVVDWHNGQQVFHDGRAEQARIAHDHAGFDADKAARDVATARQQRDTALAAAVREEQTAREATSPVERQTAEDRARQHRYDAIAADRRAQLADTQRTGHEQQRVVQRQLRDRALQESAQHKREAESLTRQRDAYREAAANQRAAFNSDARAARARDAARAERTESERYTATAHEQNRLAREADEQAAQSRALADRHQEQARRLREQGEEQTAARHEQEAVRQRDLARQQSDRAAEHRTRRDGARQLADRHREAADSEAGKEDTARREARMSRGHAAASQHSVHGRPAGAPGRHPGSSPGHEEPGSTHDERPVRHDDGPTAEERYARTHRIELDDGTVKPGKCGQDSEPKAPPHNDQLDRLLEEHGVPGDTAEERRQRFTEDRRTFAKAYEPETRDRMAGIRNEAAVHEGDIIQKVFSPQAAIDYLTGASYSGTVRGFGAKFDDVRELDTPQKTHHGFALGYENSPFSPEQHHHFAVRFKADKNLDNFTVAYSEHMDGARGVHGARTVPIGDGPGQMKYGPYMGNGYTQSDGSDPEHHPSPIAGYAVPEVRIADGNGNAIPLPNNAEIWQINADGSERLVAVYDDEQKKWVVDKDFDLSKAGDYNSNPWRDG